MNCRLYDLSNMTWQNIAQNQVLPLSVFKYLLFMSKTENIYSNLTLVKHILNAYYLVIIHIKLSEIIKPYSC